MTSGATGRRIVFVDRDGTLVEEPPDEKVDRLGKIRLMPDVVPALLELGRAGFSFVMVTNQDGLGTPALPREAFDEAHRFILELFASQGIGFEAVFICPHYEHERCACRKPGIGLLESFLANQPLDRAASFMVGDRATDLEFAARLGIPGLKVALAGDPEATWPRIVERILAETQREGRK
jgi:imidazoleglycerol-phosphate dehydratase/histidinol-phosphatase